MVYHVPTNIATISTTHEELQEDEMHEEKDRCDMLQQIMNSGILDWNPQDSWTAKHTPAHQPHLDRHIEEQPTVIEGRGIVEQVKHAQQNELRRPRGRPPKTAISSRQSQNNTSIS